MVFMFLKFYFHFLIKMLNNFKLRLGSASVLSRCTHLFIAVTWAYTFYFSKYIHSLCFFNKTINKYAFLHIVHKHIYLEENYVYTYSG